MIGDAHGRWRASFTAALIARDPAAAPPGLDVRAARRFAVHRNNMHRALAEALEAAYPAVARLVGERFFASAAREFFALAPQREASLALCGEGFPDFLDTFPAAVGVPYLADVARLERAWLEAFHAADAPPLDPARIAGRGEGLADLRLAAHPAARVVPSAHPIVSLWRHNTAAPRAAGPVTLEPRAEHALVTRPHLQVRIAALDPAASAFAQHLLGGNPAHAAYTAAAALDGAFDVTAGFACLLEAGAFVRAHHGD